MARGNWMDRPDAYRISRYLSRVKSATKQSEGRWVGLELLAHGLEAPTAIADPADGSGRMFVADRTGRVSIIRDGTLSRRPFLDLRKKMVELGGSGEERGLIGLSVSPRYREIQKFFVHYSAPLREDAPDGWDHTSRISEFQASLEEDIADIVSERIIMEVDQPFPNNNGGDIKFGPDGMLYIALGDGGNIDDAGRGHTPGIGNGQDVSSLLGKILRIDVSHRHPYAIPRSNPFANTGERQEIFAYGFRDPSGMSFDLYGEGDMFAVDIGQNVWNEVNVIVKGGDYGWNIKEASHCFSPSWGPTHTACLNEGYRGEKLIDPVLEYMKPPTEGGVGHKVIGGFIYRGRTMPSLSGEYLFGDWSRSIDKGDGSLFIADRSGEGWRMDEVHVSDRKDDRIGEFILSFGQDLEGEIYVLTSDSMNVGDRAGKVYKLGPIRS